MDFRQITILPFFVLLACIGSSVSAATGATNTLLTAEAIRAAVSDKANLGQTFDVTGTVMSYHRIPTGWMATLRTETSSLSIYERGATNWGDAPRSFELLDKIRARGRLLDHQGKIHPWFTAIERLVPGDTASLPVLAPHDIFKDRNLGKMVRLRGIVRDASRDDSDPHYIHMTVHDASGQAQVMVMHPAFLKTDHTPYLGAEVILTGICSDNQEGLRRHLGRMVNVSGLENIVITSPAHSFDDAPDLESLANDLPRSIAAKGLHRVDGTVLAVWGKRFLLLKSERQRVVRVSLQTDALPECGALIRVLGLPTTDFYNLNLLHGRWESTGKPVVDSSPALDIPPKELVTNIRGLPQMKVKNHGRTLRMTGVVRYLPSGTSEEEHLLFESDGMLIAADTSAHPDILAGLAVGCRISVTGTCVMNLDDWHIDSTEWQPSGFFLVPRAPEDIVVLSRPSWWTPRRILTLLGILAAALLGVIGWNVSLNRRARAKGRELAAEQLAHVTSELKVNERTRLAVELHDALSQTLTGVSMQIDTAAGFAEGKMPAITKCLDLASRTIDACRMELRNTLWDLRSAALDEPSMDAAIRKTLCQNLAGIDLSVRFNVSRETFSDNTAHAILRIIRELATNALRHGKATSLKIAGAIDGGKLLFSVRDNGCGFDPDLAPGISQGHFGLQGIAERLDRLNGEMKIESSPGKGAKVTVTLPIPHSGE